MSVRATTTHIDKYDVTHRIDLEQTGYGGTATELVGTSGFINFAHDNFNEANLFATPVQKGRLDYGFWINDSAGQTVLDQVLASAEGDFIIKWYRDNVLFWTGYVAPDLSAVSESAFPREAVIVAKDLTILEGQTFTLRDTRETVIAVLADALNAVYSLPITTRTSWVCNNTTTTNDFLRQAYIDTRALRLFAEDPDEDVAFTAYAVVELLARNFKLFIRQTNGVWLVEQMSAHETPSSVLTSIYNASGVFVSASNTNPVIVANSEVSVVTGSISAITPAYRRVSSTFDHRTQVSGIAYPDIVSLTEDFPGPQVDSMFFIVDGTQTITLTGRVFVVYSEAVPESSILVPPVGIIQIKYGDRYWDGVENEWTLSEIDNLIEVRDSENRDGTDISGTVFRKGFTGKINITTSELPSNPSGDNVIVITLVKSPSPGASITTYNNLNFELSNSDDEKGSAGIIFNLDQSAQSSVAYDDGVTYYGTGPSAYAMSAVRFSDVAPEPNDTKLITSWQRRGTTPDRLLHENLTKEVMDSQRSFRRILQAVLRKAYSPQNTIVYDSKAWFYIGGRFSGYTGDWEITMAENAFVTDADTFAVRVLGAGTNITSSFLTATTFATMDAIEATQGYLYRLSLPASGLIAQITVNGADVAVKAGQILRLVNPITLQSELVTVFSDKISNTIFIEPTTLTGSYPAGAYVYVSTQSQQAGIIVGENSVNIFAESTTVGTLLATVVNTSATSLSVRLNQRLKAGTDLILGDRLSGRAQSITVVNSIGPGDVTMTIQEENINAVAGSILYGSSAQTQSILQVDPFRVLTSVTQGRTQSAVATLNGALPIGTYTVIPITSPQSLTINPSTVIMIQDRAGNTQYFTTTSASQNLVGKTEIDVVSTVTTLNIQSGAAILEPSWRQTSRINQLADEIVLKVSESRVNELIAENTAGLVPAENFTFGIDEQGFTGSNATFAVVVGEIYAEYKVTNATNPHIAKTTGISYVADDNPAVNIRIKRDAGSSWNASFAWTTDGTNFFSQAFVEPPNVGTSFQIATMDLTSNVNYTGTITGVKLFLGDTIDDTFFLESFTIGKFNPQANILNDLSQSVATNEANITLNANAINSYVTGTQGLNRIANVPGSFSIGQEYDVVALDSIVAGASVKNGQILILQNPDGTFQQVTVRDNQNPLESPLKINNIFFSENISGAVLFEPSYAATSRITQQAGTLVLKAEVVEGEITKLAFISLDSTSLPDESVLQLQANQIRVDGQTTFFNNLKTLGVASRTGVNTTIRSATAPTTRNDDPIAPTALVAGDTWIDTDDGDKPYTWNGSIWVQAYTVIDGGNITTGTVTADKLNVTNLNAVATNTGALTVSDTLTMGATGEITNTAGTYIIDEDGVLVTQSITNSPGSIPTNAKLSFINSTYPNVGAQIFARTPTDLSKTDLIISVFHVRDSIVNPGNIRIVPDGGAVFLDSSLGTASITLVPSSPGQDSTSTTTGSIVTNGGVGIAKNLHVGGTGNFTGSLNAPVVGVTTITDAQSPYTVLASDAYIGVDNSANAVTVNLPAGTAGRKVTIFDSAGTASFGTITINRASTNTINGLTSTTLTTNYQSVTLLFTAGNWVKI
jgi:hypothetical protein